MQLISEQIDRNSKEEQSNADWRGDEKGVFKGLVSSNSSFDSDFVVRMLRFFEPEAELICRTASSVDYLKLAAMHETLFSKESQTPSL